MDDFLDIGGITFYDKTDFGKFLFGNKNFAEIIIYSDLHLENNSKLNEIKLDIKGITFRLDKKNLSKKQRDLF